MSVDGELQSIDSSADYLDNFRGETSRFNKQKDNLSDSGEFKTNMAASYADTLRSDQTQNTNNMNESNMVKPIFIKDQDIFGSVTPTRNMWVTNVELYKAIGQVVKPQCIKGIQRIQNMWRIYMENERDKRTLLAQGINLRGRHVNFHMQNPRYANRGSVVRIRVKNVPLSADDGLIEYALTQHNVNVVIMWHERLRVDNKATNCLTGDRIVLTKDLPEPLPRFMQVGKYTAKIFHPGQVIEDNRQDKVYHKCLEAGHLFFNCQNDWKCKRCQQSGHKMIDCPLELTTEMFNDQMSENEDRSINEATQDRQNSDGKDTTTEGFETAETAVGAGDQSEADTVAANKRSGGLTSRGQAVRQKDGRPQQTNEKQTLQNSNKDKSKKPVSVSNSQSSLKSFMNTPGVNINRLKNARTPPTPPERDGATKAQKT